MSICLLSIFFLAGRVLLATAGIFRGLGFRNLGLRLAVFVLSQGPRGLWKLLAPLTTTNPKLNSKA